MELEKCEACGENLYPPGTWASDMETWAEYLTEGRVRVLAHGTCAHEYGWEMA